MKNFLFSLVIAVVVALCSNSTATAEGVAGPTLAPEDDPQVQPMSWVTLDGRPSILRCTNTQHALMAIIWDEQSQTLEYQEVVNPEACPDYKGPERIVAFEDDPLDVRVHPVYIIIDGTIAIARCTTDLQLLIVYWNEGSSTLGWREVPSMTCFA